jgi:8-oxo-(d)GTP phosphatase
MADLVPIRAAGGVVAASGTVALVHRPRYDDWSLPKGKLRPGEHRLAAAVREVYEETGVRAAPLLPLPSVDYLSQGVPKVVDYWAMRVVSTERFTPGAEIDEVRWLPVPHALALLSYPYDASVLRAFAAAPPVTSVVLLVRHASAGKRGVWPGPDADRPLDPEGLAQARRLADELALYAPTRLLSASPRRCVSTLEPLSTAVDLPIEIDPHFDEGQSPATAAEHLRAIATAGPSTVVSSQRGVIPDAVAVLDGARRRYATPKGTGWLLPFAGDRPLGAYSLPR